MNIGLWKKDTVYIFEICPWTLVKSSIQFKIKFIAVYILEIFTGSITWRGCGVNFGMLRRKWRLNGRFFELALRGNQSALCWIFYNAKNKEIGRLRHDVNFLLCRFHDLCLSIYLSIYLSVRHLSLYLYIYLSEKGEGPVLNAEGRSGTAFGAYCW